VVDGISVLGTTGFVELWNDHLGEMKGDRIRHSSKVVLTTGRIGIRYSTMLFPDHTVVLAGRRISEVLEAIRNASVVYGSGRSIELAEPYIEGAVHEIKNYRELHLLPRDAVVLSTGDSMFSGLGKFAGEDDIVIPGNLVPAGGVLASGCKHDKPGCDHGTRAGSDTGTQVAGAGTGAREEHIHAASCILQGVRSRVRTP